MEKYNYKKFAKFLINNEDVVIKITYDKLEEILGKKLPKSAYIHSAYFSNSKSHPISKVWVELGYKKIELKIGEYIVIKKNNYNI